MIYRLGFWLVGRRPASLSSVEFRDFERGRFSSAFAGLSQKVVGSVRGMENKTLIKTEIRDRIDARVTHVKAWTTLIELLEQATEQSVTIPCTVLGEIARSIRGLVLEIQELLDELATQSNARS